MKPTRLDVTYRSLFLFAKLWGMFPFYLENEWKLQISKPALLHSLLMVTLSIFCFCKAMVSQGRLRSFTYLTELFALNLAIVGSIGMLLFRKGMLSNALFTVLSVQSRHAITVHCKRYLWQLWICSLALFVILTYRLFDLTNKNWSNTLFKLAYFLPTWMMFSSIMVFSSVCLLIGDSFVLTSAVVLNPYRGLVELDFLLQTHFVLTLAAESVNLCYGLQNLLVFITTFLTFTSRVHSVLSGGSIFYVIVAVFFFPFMCWNIVYACNQVKRKTKIPFHFASIKEVQFSACGFFILDFPIICSMTSAATSYLVILFQFATYEKEDNA